MEGVDPLTLEATSVAQPGDLQLVQSIALPDGRGRIDHLDIDLERGRLFVAALGNNTVEFVDLRAGRRSARLERLHEPQGVVYVAATKRLFVTSGESGSVEVFAADPLSPIRRADALDDADNIRYEPESGRIYVGFDSALAVLEGSTMRLMSRIKLSGHPESFQLESRGSRIFVNVPTAHRIAVIDRKQGEVRSSWSLGEARANFPMALDEASHRLFVATRRPAALLVFDTESGKRITSVPIGGDADDLFFDGERKQILAICRRPHYCGAPAGRRSLRCDRTDTHRAWCAHRAVCACAENALLGCSGAALFASRDSCVHGEIACDHGGSRLWCDAGLFR